MSDALEKRIKKHIIGKPHRFLAVSPLGFEQALSKELESILGESATERQHSTEDGKVEFSTKLTEAWKVVAVSRIANRVLMEVTSFKAENFRELEKKASDIPWELYLDEITGNALQTRDEREAPSKSINIHVTCKHSRLYHSDAIAERLYNVITPSNIPQSEASSEGKARPHTPKPDTSGDPIAQNLYVNFLDDRCTIWLDLAGEELYKRGFERFVNDAPLKETIASAMIFEALHFLPSTSYCLLDLMSGSGTFSLEAACIANKIIPGTCRDFALKHQPAFKEATWNFIIRQETRDDKCVGRMSRPCLHGHDRVQHLGLERSDNPKTNSATATLASHVIAQAHDNIGSVMPDCKPSVATLASHVIAQAQCEAIHQPIIAKIITSDISERAVNIIKHNVECSPLANISPAPITPQQKDFFSYTAKEIADACGDASPVLVLNPPYGKRLDFDAPKLYTQIGKKLTELARNLHHFKKDFTVAILAPKDDTRDGARYTCTANLLHECPALSPENNSAAKRIVTSHGGFSLNAFFATI